jgi:hypothetical protein
LHFYNIENDKFFKLVLLRLTRETPVKTYQVKQVSDYIHAQRQGVQDIDLRDKRLLVDKNDVIGFLIFDKMPIPYEDKVPCSSLQNHLVHKVQVLEFKPGDNVEFATEAECLQFSYVADVVSLGENRHTIVLYPSI